jgi:hypothetical protein
MIFIGQLLEIVKQRWPSSFRVYCFNPDDRLHVLANSGNNTTDRGSKTSKAERGKECDDFRGQVFEETGSLALLDIGTNSADDTANGRSKTSEAKRCE